MTCSDVRYARVRPRPPFTSPPLQKKPTEFLPCFSELMLGTEGKMLRLWTLIIDARRLQTVKLALGRKMLQCLARQLPGTLRNSVPTR